MNPADAAGTLSTWPTRRPRCRRSPRCAFRAAALHGRFRDAASSLGVTEWAISHQVRRLEDFLRTALLHRSGQGVRLTAAGRRYLEQIDPAIRQIQSATEAVLRPSGRDVVRLTLPPSRAATWLIPQLSAFERQHPDVDRQVPGRTDRQRRAQADHGRGSSMLDHLNNARGNDS